MYSDGAWIHKTFKLVCLDKSEGSSYATFHVVYEWRTRSPFSPVKCSSQRFSINIPGHVVHPVFKFNVCVVFVKLSWRKYSGTAQIHIKFWHCTRE